MKSADFKFILAASVPNNDEVLIRSAASQPCRKAKEAKNPGGAPRRWLGMHADDGGRCLPRISPQSLTLHSSGCFVNFLLRLWVPFVLTLLSCIAKALDNYLTKSWNCTKLDHGDMTEQTKVPTVSSVAIAMISPIRYC